MGTRSPNMSIYIPARGEDLYSTAFFAGMMNVDAHDHSGAPENGVQIGTDGIQDGAITPAKLSQQIIIIDTVQTTDATPTAIDTVDVPESSAVTIEGRLIALSADATDSLGCDFFGVFRRGTGGNVVEIGSQVIDTNSNFATASFSLVADVGNQEVTLTCTGEAATTINWRVAYNILVLPVV